MILKKERVKPIVPMTGDCRFIIQFAFLPVSETDCEGWNGDMFWLENCLIHQCFSRSIGKWETEYKLRLGALTSSHLDDILKIVKAAETKESKFVEKGILAELEKRLRHSTKST